MDIQRSGTTKRYSDYVCHGGVVHIVEVPASADADAKTQTVEILASIEKMLIQAGSDKSRLLSATIYLTSIENDYDAMNEVWDNWVPNGTAPARACVEVSRLANKGYKVEIAITAAQNSQ
ncbi:hypothetical protein AKO1_012527 [Acrasis kona]|uniref:Uncharacterized protein n=1 Tax=Acrasis kona TaxID=1008807 RepID=A0AAW2YXP6_9EUKA